MSAFGFETASALPSVKPERLPEEKRVERNGDAVSSDIEVRRYVRPDGWVSRYWAVYIEGELLAVVLYKRGARAIADRLESVSC